MKLTVFLQDQTLFPEGTTVVPVGRRRIPRGMSNLSNNHSKNHSKQTIKTARRSRALSSQRRKEELGRLAQSSSFSWNPIPANNGNEPRASCFHRPPWTLRGRGISEGKDPLQLR